MKKVGIFIKNLSPLTLSDNRLPADGILRTKKYIPGAYLKGAIANQLLQGCTDMNHCFDNLIADTHQWGTEIVFPNCYPNLNAYTFPLYLPATAKSCQWKPGFGQESSLSDQHGVFDTLLNQIIYQQASAAFTQGRYQSRKVNFIHSKYNTLIERGSQQCSQCSAKAVQYQTEYVKPHGIFREISVRTHWQTRQNTPQDQNIGSPSKAAYHHFECICERTWFLGYAFLPSNPSLLAMYKKALESITHLGEMEEDGIGRVRITVREMEDHDLSFKQRILKFNQKYRQMQEEHLLPQSEELITVNLQSEAIIKDQAGRLTSTLSSSTLIAEMKRAYRQHTGDELSDGQISCTEIISFSQPTYVSELPRIGKLAGNEILAAARGSVFAFAFAPLTPPWLLALECLEKYGLGESRGEGYGQIIICDPFHLEVGGE